MYSRKSADVAARPLRALRANRVFGTDEKRIRTENTVIGKSKDGMRFLYKIADCARIRFSSVCNRRSARTGRRPRKSRPPQRDRHANARRCRRATIARSARQPRFLYG
jgi:hypothetical protein